MKLFLLLLAIAGLLAGQDQLSSVERQKLSVQKQVRSAAATNGFFLTPWIAPAMVTAMSPISGVEAKGDCEALPDSSLQALILESSQREGVDPKLIHAVVKQESGGKPCAVSVKGAQGLMQLMPGTQNDLGVRNPFDASENISGGVRYLKQMLERYGGNTALALAAYNAGPQRVEPGGKIPDIPETQSYVMRILAGLNMQ